MARVEREYVAKTCFLILLGRQSFWGLFSFFFFFLLFFLESELCINGVCSHYALG